MLIDSSTRDDDLRGSSINLTTNMYSCSLQPLAVQLQHSLTAIRTELQSAIAHADDSNFTTVMGTSCVAAGKFTPKELQDTIKANPKINSAMGTDSGKNQAGRKAIRGIIESSTDRAAAATFTKAAAEFNAALVLPVQQALMAMVNQLKAIEQDAGQLMAASLRKTGAGKISEERAEAISAYTESIKLLNEGAVEIANYATLSASKSVEIYALMNGGGSYDPAVLQQMQAIRSSLDDEIKHVEKRMLQHFDSGLGSSSGLRKLDPLKIPENLNQDRSDELIQAIRHFAKQRAKEYCWLLPELYRVLDDFDAALGVRYKPPTKADGYNSVCASMRDGYEAANSAFWEELWSKLTPEAKAKLQATTNYGIDDQETVRCEPKDGVMAVFALLTVYKPVGATHREDLVSKLEASTKRFNDGSSPDQVVGKLREILSKAMKLGIKLNWAKVGKPVVTLLVERSNNFHARLGKYQKAGAIVDTEDCGVELEQMYTDIQQACKDMQNAGLDLKRVSGRANFTNKDNQVRPCRYGSKCTRDDCRFGHEDGKDAKRHNKDSQRNGGDNKRKHGADGNQAQDKKTSVCKAVGCKTSSKGWRFCTACHRKGIEDGGKIKMKDGTTWQNKKTGGDAKRIAQLEAKVSKLSKDEMWDNGSDEETDQVGMFGIEDDSIVGPKSAERSDLTVVRLPAGDNAGEKFKLVRQ